MKKILIKYKESGTMVKIEHNAWKRITADIDIEMFNKALENHGFGEYEAFLDEIPEQLPMLKFLRRLR